MTADSWRAVMKLLLLLAVYFASMLALPRLLRAVNLVVVSTGTKTALVLLSAVTIGLIFMHIAGEPERKRKAHAAGGTPGVSPHTVVASAAWTRWTTAPILPSHAVVLTIVAFFGAWANFHLLMERFGLRDISLWIALGIAAVAVYALNEIQRVWLLRQHHAAVGDPAQGPDAELAAAIKPFALDQAYRIPLMVVGFVATWVAVDYLVIDADAGLFAGLAVMALISNSFGSALVRQIHQSKAADAPVTAPESHEPKG